MITLLLRGTVNDIFNKWNFKLDSHMDIFIHTYVFTATSQQQKINYTSTMGSQRAGHDQATNTHTHTHTHAHTH